MILLILVIGLILRLISLNQSLWLDEATSALVAKMSVKEIFSGFLPGDFHPPFYYLLLKYWSDIFGFSEISLRIPSVLFGIATIYIVYLIGREVVNRNAGLAASGLLATSGLAIYYSQEARMYSMAAFLVSFLIFSFVKTIRRGRVGDWVLFSVLLAFAAMTDYVAILIFPVFWIYAFLVKQKNSWWEKFFASHIIFGMITLLWASTFILQLKNGLSVSTTSPLWYQTLGQTSFKNLALIPVKFMIGRISFEPQWLYGLIVILSAVLFGSLLVRSRRNLSLLWMWLLVPIILGAIISFKVPTLSYFRYLFCLPAFYLLAGVGIDGLGKHKIPVLIFFFGLNLFTSGYYLLSPKFQREDWRLATSAIGNDKIIFPADSQKEALIYYGKGDQIISVDQMTKNDKEVWLSRYVWEIFDSSDAARLKIESMGYNKTQEFNFRGVVLWKYNKK